MYCTKKNNPFVMKNFAKPFVVWQETVEQTDDTKGEPIRLEDIDIIGAYDDIMQAKKCAKAVMPSDICILKEEIKKKRDTSGYVARYVFSLKDNENIYSAFNGIWNRKAEI